MTLLKYTFILFSTCTVFIMNTAGQNHVNIQTKNEAVKTLKFIDGIELKRNEIHSSGNSININQSNSLIIPVSSTELASYNIESITGLQIKYAQILNVEIETVKNLALLNFIEEWWRTRYRFGGSSKSGIDCSAFAGLLQRNVYGNELPRMAKEQYKLCEKISREEINEGDLVFFNTRGGVSHVGVYLANGYFVHSSTKEGVTISSLDEDYYHRKFISAGRIIVQ